MTSKCLSIIVYIHWITDTTPLARGFGRIPFEYAFSFGSSLSITKHSRLQIFFQTNPVTSLYIIHLLIETCCKNHSWQWWLYCARVSFQQRSAEETNIQENEIVSGVGCVGCCSFSSLVPCSSTITRVLMIWWIVKGWENVGQFLHVLQCWQFWPDTEMKCKEYLFRSCTWEWGQILRWNLFLAALQRAIQQDCEL